MSCQSSVFPPHRAKDHDKRISPDKFRDFQGDWRKVAFPGTPVAADAVPQITATIPDPAKPIQAT